MALPVPNRSNEQVCGDVLVTGATGFIGGRLVESIIAGRSAVPRVLVRDASREACLMQHGTRVQIIHGSIGDRAAVDQAVAGCTAVFHCAYDGANAEANVAGIDALIAACTAHNVRLVHVSTFATYFPLDDGDLDESSAPKRSGNPYCENKLDLEGRVLKAVDRSGLDAVVIMPTIVYGPMGRTWTVGPAQQVLTGKVVLPENGEGLCNAVYVDDVCQGLLRAASTPAARGQRYFVSGAAPVTWKAFFDSYAAGLGRPGPECVPRAILETSKPGFLKRIRTMVADPKRIVRSGPLRKLALLIRAKLGPKVSAKLGKLYSGYRTVAPEPVFTPDQDQIVFYSSKCRVLVERAKDQLGYCPEYDLARGMSLTTHWLRANFARGKR